MSVDMQQFREVSRTRTIYSTETHTSDKQITHSNFVSFVCVVERPALLFCARCGEAWFCARREEALFCACHGEAWLFCECRGEAGLVVLCGSWRGLVLCAPW